MPGPYTFSTAIAVGTLGMIAWADSVGAAFNESTPLATADVLVLRDANGNAQFADPVADADAATKHYVDSTSAPASATTPTANVLALRDAAGRSQFADPAAAQDVATKNYVDTNIIKVLNPSGADDGSRINTALNAGGGTTPTTVVLKGGTFNVGGGALQSNGAYLSQPSNTTLILMDATLKLANAAAGPMLMNANPTPTGAPVDTKLRILGIGSAVIDGNAANNPHITTTFLVQWKSVPVLYVGVTTWRIKDVTIMNPSLWGFSPQNTSDGKFLNITSSCDVTTANQSPIQVYGTNDNIEIDVHGQSADDGVALLTYTKQQLGAGVYPSGLTYPGGNISNVRVTMKGKWATSTGNCLRLLNGDGGTISGVWADITDTGTASVGLMIGPTTYVTTPPTYDQCQNVSVAYKGGAVGALVGLYQSCRQVTVRAAEMTGNCIPIRADQANGQRIDDLVVRNVSYAYPSTSQAFMYSTSSGITFNRPVFENIQMIGTKFLLSNTAVVNNLRMSGVKIGTLATSGGLFNSATPESGVVSNVEVDTFSGTAKRVSAASCLLRFGPNMPILRSGDTIPSAVTKGSEIVCDHTLDPTGGAGTTGGKYIANGSSATSWVKMVDLGASF